MFADILIALVSTIIGFGITHFYYRKSLSSQAEAWGQMQSDLLDKVKSLSPNDKLILKEQRLNIAVNDYKKKGTPKFIIDTFTDLSTAEKREMYDIVLLRAKGKKGKNNPYIE
jgi:hypothetical protein